MNEFHSIRCNGCQRLMFVGQNVQSKDINNCMFCHFKFLSPVDFTRNEYTIVGRIERNEQ